MILKKKNKGKKRKCKKQVKCKELRISLSASAEPNKNSVSPHNSTHSECSSLRSGNRKPTVKEEGAEQFTACCISFRPFSILFSAKTDKINSKNKKNGIFFF